MYKNTASQKVVVELFNVDGSAYTTQDIVVLVLKDGAGQNVGAGVIAYVTGGLCIYTPTQAETNADHVAITFYQTSINRYKTVVVYTSKLRFQSDGQVIANAATIDDPSEDAISTIGRAVWDYLADSAVTSDSMGAYLQSITGPMIAGAVWDRDLGVIIANDSIGSFVKDRISLEAIEQAVWQSELLSTPVGSVVVTMLTAYKAARQNDIAQEIYVDSDGRIKANADKISGVSPELAVAGYVWGSLIDTYDNTSNSFGQKFANLPLVLDWSTVVNKTAINDFPNTTFAQQASDQTAIVVQIEETRS